MDGLIFVALAVAWAVYLVPKAKRHHDEVVRSRPVDDFSDQIRVVARREATADADTELIISSRSAARAKVSINAEPSGTSEETEASDAESELPGASEVPRQVEKPRGRFARLRLRRVLSATVSREARKGAPARAVAEQPKQPKAERPERRPASPARRRRRVLTVLVLALAAVAGVAGAGYLNWWWLAAPVALLVGWLAACRLMVRSERSRRPVRERRRAPASRRTLQAEPELVAEVESVETAAPEPAATAGGWDLRPMTLPTYVTKDAAERRAVPEMDLDSTGVWSSGRSSSDSQLARAAEEEAAARKEREQSQRRAFGA